MVETRWLVLLVTAGLIIRILALNVAGESFDIGLWIDWSRRLAEFGPLKFYTERVYTNFLPGYLYLLWLVGLLAERFSNLSSYLPTILKIPSIVADVGIFYLLYRIGQKLRSAKIGIIIASAYFLNPVVIFNGALWGQIDSIVSFWVLLAIYLLTLTKQLYLGLISFSIALLIKPQAFLFVFPVVIAFLGSYQTKKIITALLITTLIFIILIWPFFPQNSILGFIQLVLKMSSDYPFTSANAFNLWWFAVGGWFDEQLIHLIIGGFLLITSLFISLFVSHNYPKPVKIFILAMLVSYAFFLFPTRIHERYLFPFFAFAPIVLAVIFNKFWPWFVFIILTTLHLANLYYAYGKYVTNIITKDWLILTILKFSPAVVIFHIVVWALILLVLLNFSLNKTRKN